MQQEKETHLTPIGYLLWFFGGLFGYHRFYYGRQLTGLLWMFTPVSYTHLRAHET